MLKFSSLTAALICLTPNVTFSSQYFLAQSTGSDLPICYIENNNSTVVDLTNLCEGNVLENITDDPIKRLIKTKQCSKCNFEKADLSGINLIGADLSYANLSYANLSGANLIGANLTGANIANTILKGTVMPDGSIHN